jgi:lipopolysaccharide export system protein LptA
MKSPARFRRDPRSLKLPLALLGLGLLILQPALAKQDDRNQPMNFSSKSMDGFNAPNTVTTLTGSVVTTQGTMKMTGAVAKLYLDENTQVARAVVTAPPGGVAHIEQLDDCNNLMQGDANQLDYDNINGIAVLTGNAVVKQQGRGEFHGDKLTYNTQSALITGEAGGDGLVHGVILPKAQPGAAAPAGQVASPTCRPNAAPAPAPAAAAPKPAGGH